VGRRLGRRTADRPRHPAPPSPPASPCCPTSEIPPHLLPFIAPMHFSRAAAPCKIDGCKLCAYNPDRPAPLVLQGPAVYDGRAFLLCSSMEQRGGDPHGSPPLFAVGQSSIASVPATIRANPHPDRFVRRSRNTR